MFEVSNIFVGVIKDAVLQIKWEQNILSRKQLSVGLKCLQTTMSILVTGGRGNTASPLSALLNDVKVPFVVASRSKDPSSTYQQAHFDWQDESTYGTLLKSTPIKAAYLVGPPSNDFVGRMKAFIDIARRHGVKRFVLLSGSPVEAGGPGQGQVHEYLMTLGVEYTVLRPSWFQREILWVLGGLDTDNRRKHD